MVEKEHFPMNLLDAIAKDCRKIEWEYPLPYDFDQSLAYVLAGLSERTAQCVMSYYRDGKTYKEIGTHMGVGDSRIGTIIRTAIHRMAHISRRRFLEIGVQGMIEENAREARERAVNDKLNTAVTLISQIAEQLENKSVENVFSKITDKVTENSRKTKIEELGLSLRTTNCLLRAGKETLGDILDMATDELKIRNLGVKSLREVVDKVHEMGLLFRDERENAK